MKFILISLGSLAMITGTAQTKPGTTFYGESNARAILCPERKNALAETDVDKLISEILWKSYHIKNSYIIINCADVANCQATMFEGKPYILYNPSYLGRVKKLNFSSATLPDATEKDWETLTLLAHELGHHLNGHLTNPKPDATQWSQELEADETAGFIIHLMGGTLAQAQLAFRNVPEQGSYTHPGRQKRLDAVAKGWNDAGPVTPVNPVPKNEVNTVTDLDGNIYNTVKIGTQAWMQSNLNVTRFRDGMPVAEAKTLQEWKAAADNNQPAWCWYENEEENGKKYGRLYNWYAVNDPRGLAPAGYHIPSKAEWDKLELFLGSNAADKLKASGLWNNPYDKSNNSSQFSALPGGERNSEAVFEYIDKNGRWWCSDVSEDMFFSGRELMAGTGNISKVNLNRWYGLSVRCVKNEVTYLPDGFTPNADGINDLAKPDLSGIKTLKGFSIFNRWGQRVFFTDKAGEGWDGKFNGKLQDTGIYTWILEFISTEGNSVTEKGTITLVR